jgi:hypothetical protein
MEHVAIFQFLLHHFQVLTLILLLRVGLFGFGVLFDHLSLRHMVGQIGILVDGSAVDLTYLYLTFDAFIADLSWAHLRQPVHWLILWMWIQLQIFHVLSLHLVIDGRHMQPLLLPWLMLLVAAKIVEIVLNLDILGHYWIYILRIL